MRATRLAVANYNTKLSSDSLGSGTGSSNPLRSANESVRTDTCPSLRVQCEIERVRTSLVTSGFFCPLASFGEVALAWSYEDLLTSLSPHDVWTAAEESRDIHLAIGLEALRILRATSQRADLKSVPAFAIGSGFYDSLVRNSARYGQALHRLDEAGGLA
jgi:hypothetical protein